MVQIQVLEGEPGIVGERGDEDRENVSWTTSSAVVRSPSLLVAKRRSRGRKAVDELGEQVVFARLDAS